MRAVAHVHSDWSYDGRWSLPALAAAFSRRRCSVVLMTEHDVGFDEERWRAYREACAAASDASILLVPGLEYSDSENRVHVVVWGDAPFFGEGLPTRELLMLAAEHSAASFLMHPARRDVWSDVDPVWAGLLTGVEMWNRKYDGVAPSRHGCELLRRYEELVPLAGLDFHSARQFFPLRLELPDEVRLDVAEIYECVHAGRFDLRALGTDARRFESGSGLATARVAESARRSLARTVRRGAAAVRSRRA